MALFTRSTWFSLVRVLRLFPPASKLNGVPRRSAEAVDESADITGCASIKSTYARFRMVEKRFSRDKRFHWWFAKVYVSPLALMFPRVIDMWRYTYSLCLSFTVNGTIRFPLPFSLSPTTIFSTRFAPSDGNRSWRALTHFIKWHLVRDDTFGEIFKILDLLNIFLRCTMENYSQNVWEILYVSSELVALNTDYFRKSWSKKRGNWWKQYSSREIRLPSPNAVSSDLHCRLIRVQRRVDRARRRIDFK